MRPHPVEPEARPVDLEAAFLAQPSLRALYTDHVHPNDAGYEVMAQAFFEAITLPAP